MNADASLLIHFAGNVFPPAEAISPSMPRRCMSGLQACVFHSQSPRRCVTHLSFAATPSKMVSRRTFSPAAALAVTLCRQTCLLGGTPTVSTGETLQRKAQQVRVLSVNRSSLRFKTVSRETKREIQLAKNNDKSERERAFPARSHW